ncbi:MAG: hypothetical protein LBI38_00035 [Oscillospiraceae bacterium]|jgi:cell division protein FtsB|nr:hypothetical protein [Oscillospiraceae bacterium]
MKEIINEGIGKGRRAGGVPGETEMYLYRTNLAYDFATFDVEEIRSKREARVNITPVNTLGSAAARYGNWFVLLLGLGVAVAMAAMLISSKVTLNEIAAENSAATVQYEAAAKENARLQAKLDGMITPAKVEEYAQNELGLRKAQTSQVSRIAVNIEKITEIAATDDGDVFVRINNWFDEFLEYLGFE